MTPSHGIGIVHVVDDDASTRTSLERLLTGEGYEVALYASDEALLAVADPTLAGCVVLDLHMPGASGLEVQDILQARGCRVPIVFLTGRGDVPSSVRAMKRGAIDFLQKPVVPDELFAAVAAGLNADTDRRLALMNLSGLRAAVDALSHRQRQVWLRVVRGDLNKQVAYDLGIVERTVKMHRARVMEKLGARSPADLVRMAERLGLSATAGDTDAG